MTVTLSNGAVINIEAGKTTGSVVVDTPANDVYKNGSTALIVGLLPLTITLAGRGDADAVPLRMK